MAFHMNGLFWHMLQIFSSLLKKTTAYLSEPPVPLANAPRPRSSSSWPQFTVSPSLSTSKSSTSENHFIPYAKWHQTDNTWLLTLVCTTWEILKPAHPMDSYRQHRSTTTQPPPRATLSSDGLSGLQSPAEVSLALWSGPLYRRLFCMVWTQLPLTKASGE